MFVVEAGADLAASQGQRGDVALQVVPVLVEEQLVVFETAPALPPAVIGQDVQVTCQSKPMKSLRTDKHLRFPFKVLNIIFSFPS